MIDWTEANGVALRYALAGEGAVALVLVHEAGGSLESWHDVVALLGPGYRTLRYDQRGFGLSERSRTLTIDGMVEDLHGLLEALEIRDPVYLCGTALGATLVLEFAARHPERVAGVIATSPITGGIPEQAAQHLEQRARQVTREGMRSVADASLERSYPPNLRGDKDRFEQYRARFLGNDSLSFAALTRSYGRIDLPRRYGDITCPVLVVGCTDDSIKPAAECAEVAAALPRGRYVEVASGHFIGVQSPQTLAGLARDFLEQSNG